ncbi:MAG: DUF2339 domain-containing protein [Gemmatimonadales bacterium]
MPSNSERDARDIEQRLEKIEEQIAGLQYTVDRLAYTVERRQGTPPPEPDKTQRAQRSSPKGRRAQTDEQVTPSAAYGSARSKRDDRTMLGKSTPLFDTSSLTERGSEYWLSRAGIGLVLFAAVFFFKYAVDEGWLTPTLRVSFGLLLGITLYVLGLRLHFDRAWFSRVMLGGSIATFYITVFAATQLYELVSFEVGFGAMVSVTVLAFYSALWQDQPVLSIIGVLGGYLTPFFLESDGSAWRFAVYHLVLTGGTAAVFVARGWRPLLGLAVVGAWATLALGIFDAGGMSTGDRFAVQLAVLIAWLAFWIGPVVRSLRSPSTADGSPLPPIHPDSNVTDTLVGREAHVLAVLTPLMALAFSSAIWRFPLGVWGGAALGITTIYGVCTMALVHAGRRDLAIAHFAGAVVTLTVALALLIDTQWLLVAWAAEGVALHAIGTKAEDSVPTILAHALFMIAAVWLAVRLLGQGVTGPPVFNSAALTDAAVIAAFVVSVGITSSKDHAKSYLLIAHVGLLALVWREWTPLLHGAGYVTIIWGVYAIGLLIFALFRRQQSMQTAALATLGLVVGKLLLVDLSRTEAIWRVMLLLGFGVVFLTLSYYLRPLWQSAMEGRSVSEDDPGL